MNIYQKLQKARIELQNLNLKKTGNNKFSGFTYYELGDFLPAINVICDKFGLITRFSIVGRGEDETAVLALFNSDEISESITFTSPTAEAKIGMKKDGTGGADPIQNLGGKITYMRRYMFFIAFEMVENDIVERINRELTEDLDEKDIKKINDAKDEQQLLKIAGILKSRYKPELIKPYFDKRREELQDNVKKVEK